MPNDDLARLGDDYWDAFLERDPVQGTALGEHRYDDRLSDISPEGEASARRRLRELAARVEAIAESTTPESLTDEEALSLSALRYLVSSDLAYLEADPLAYTVDPMNGPQVALLNIASFQPLRDPADGEALLARWHAMAPWVDQLIAAHRRGLEEDRRPLAIHIERVIDELDELLDRPDAEWPLMDPVRAAEPPAGWTDDAWKRLAAGVAATVGDEIRPAFGRYRSFLAEIAPRARGDREVGLGHLPGGAELYARLARAHTTTPSTPEELHAIGLEEVDRIEGEIADAGRLLLGTRDLASTLAALRADASLYFRTPDEVIAVARRSLDAANAAIPDWFGRLPATPCEVVAMLPHEEAHSTIAYYREPAADGGRPGRYYVNTSAPETRPRYEAEALAFHEAVPGHHLQIAIGQELVSLPTFRRHADVTAFIEGWGLYAERLANEMGLYSSDLDRVGMLSYDAWRASRLVVDTGMHAFGWPRSRAIAFMTEHSALAVNNITNEVDRYLVWPGQALAYKVGQLEHRRLRTDAEEALGARFDVRAFHDAVLGHGPLPLATVREAVSRDLGVSLS